MREIKKAICLLVCMMCLMPVTLAGCAGQQDAGQEDQQQASEDQSADSKEQAAEQQISYEDAKVSYLGPKGTYTELGEYHYLIECEGCSYDTFEELKEKTGLELRYLGSFAVK